EKWYKVGNDSVPYLPQFSGPEGDRKAEATDWLRANPHRVQLGYIGLKLIGESGEAFTLDDIESPIQRLDLWTGELSSHFTFDGFPVEVSTFAHPHSDELAFRIQSPLIGLKRLYITLSFPYPTRDKFRGGCNFDKPGQHATGLIQAKDNSLLLERKLDALCYYVRANWSGSAAIKQKESHRISIMPGSEEELFELSVRFAPFVPEQDNEAFAQTAEKSAREWETFWESGGAVDFSGSTDPRAKELERRVVLSQYLTRVQCTGPYPPQETGLTFNSWHGKFHLEMHWWHMVHFLLWNRQDWVEQQLNWYFDIFDKAKKTAEWQGYKGVRWPKMTNPDGSESPSSVGVFLIWQQPHPIYYIDLLYRQAGNDTTILHKYQAIEEATADFMASYARWDSAGARYVLGPALIPAQECFDPKTTLNPVFETAYWYWALKTAQEHRKQRGDEPREEWQHVIDHLAGLPVGDSLYLFSENATDSYSNPRYFTDHPIVLGIAGFLPITDKIDTTLLRNTFQTIRERWEWESCWGWDFPLAALAAGALNEPETAVDFLLMDTQKNRYLANGHNYQDERLPMYLPGNGALLTAVAHLCTRYDGNGNNGFPKNKGWKVRYENLNPLYP
ncbi:MAG TPA: hypothetical protein PLK12_15190, partial [Prolixibacteraceae bacterium]|nr:hypothetical protein [Prolixibacteraceae bacterium]